MISKPHTAMTFKLHIFGDYLLMKSVDYRKLRFNNITSPQFSHLLYLIFWPIYGLVFLLLERGLKLDYTYVACSFDNKIPFCEWFVIPYYLWFVFIAGMLVYTAFFDISAFKRYMLFIMVTYSVTCVIYVVFPNAQGLRPVTFERDNILVDIVKTLYSFDTNTNVCPSLHVVGSFAVMFAAFDTERFKTPLWRIFFFVSAVIISLSTVFLKQHSIIDVIAGLALCTVAYPVCYTIPKMREAKQKAAKLSEQKKEKGAKKDKEKEPASANI